MTTLRYCRLFTLPVKINKVVAKNACSTFVQKVEGGSAGLTWPRPVELPPLVTILYPP